MPSQWRHNECDGGVSNHRHLDCLLNHLFTRWSKKTSNLRTAGFPSPRASNAENVSIWWRLHAGSVSMCWHHYVSMAKLCTYFVYPAKHQCAVHSYALHMVYVLRRRADIIFIDFCVHPKQGCICSYSISCEHISRVVVFRCGYVIVDVVTLTHWGLVTPFSDIDLCQHWLR